MMGQTEFQGDGGPGGPTLDQIRDRLMLGALAYVPVEGWSEGAFRSAAQECGYDPALVSIAFGRNIEGAASHLLCLADRRMAEDSWPSSEIMPSSGTQGRLYAVLRSRLLQWAPHKEAFRKAYLSLLQFCGPGEIVRTGWATSDVAWRTVGDVSADISWYTKRASLAAIWGTTTFFWLQDRSEGEEATLRVLRRQMEGLVSAMRGRKRIHTALNRTMRRIRPFHLL